MKTVNFNLRLDPVIHQKIKAIGKKKRHSLNTTIEIALEEYVAAWEAEHGPLALEQPDEAQD